jgi:DNA-binding phage protein
LAPAIRAATTGTYAVGRRGQLAKVINMRLWNYRKGLLERLKNRRYAAEYLALVRAEKDDAAFVIALKDLAEAAGGMISLAKRRK